MLTKKQVEELKSSLVPGDMILNNLIETLEKAVEVIKKSSEDCTWNGEKVRIYFGRNGSG